jgi:hypothetical protein
MEVAAVIIAIAVGVMMVAGNKMRLRPDRSEAVRRVLRHITRRPIAELAEGGAAVVRGTAVTVDAPLIAPVSGVPCIGYHLLVHVCDAIAVDDARCGSFAIDDGTGTLRVDRDDLEFVALDAPVRYGPELPPAIAARIPRAWLGLPVRWTEGVLRPGMSVAACGLVSFATGAGEMYREARRNIELIASPSFPLVASPDADLAVPSHRPYQPEELRD